MNTPGERLRYIRELLDLPLVTMAKRHGLGRFQLYNWESGRVKVTQMVLTKYLPCLEKEGIKVEPTWILNGLGNAPTKTDPFPISNIDFNHPITIGEIPESALMIKDVSSFISNHDNPICIFVESNFMKPYYNEGDYVCGDLMFSFEKIASLVDRNCIILIKGKGPIVRRILSVNGDKTFDLVGTSENHHSKIEHVVIDSAAEIILHRKLMG